MSQLSRRGNLIHKSNINAMTALTLFGLWISNTILGCHGLPRPEAKNDEFRPNFAAMHGAPLITPLMEDIVLEVNTNYTLRCESNEEIVWRVPSLFSRYSIESFPTFDPNRPFGSHLYLRDVEKEAVGYYYCIKKSSLEKEVIDMEEEEFDDLVNNNQASSIYIYVNDLDNLLVPIEYPVGYAYQYQDLTIPCKPTLPSVEVLLTTPNGDTYSSESTGRYDPRRGFVIQIGALTDGGMYMCRPKVPSQNNEEEETSIDIDIRGNQNIDLSTTAKLTTDVKLAEITTTTTTTINTPTSVKATTTTKTTKTSPTTNKIIRQTSGNSVKSTLTKVVNVTTNRILENVDVRIQNCNHNCSYANGDNVKIDNNNEVTADIVDDVEVANVDYVEYDELSSLATTTPSIDNNLVASTVDLTNGVGFINVGVLRPLGKRDVRTTPSSRRSSHNKFGTTPRSHTTHINKPTITSDSKGHAYVGDSFQLTCVVKTVHDVTYTAEWVLPPGVDESRIEKKEAKIYNKTETHAFGSAVLTIRDATKSDSGNYKCIVTDHSKNKAHNYYLMTILNQNESYIDMKEPNDYYIIKEKANKTITLNVKYRGHPPATLKWYKPDGTEIHPTHKYNINTTDSSSMLRILSPQMIDSGDYVVRAENGFEPQTRTFNVSISDAPIVTVNDVYVQEGEEAHLECRVLSYPTANVTWVFKPCKIQPRWPSCDNKIEQRLTEYISIPVSGEIGIELIHRLDFRPTTPGLAYCIATNKIDQKKGKGHVLIGDIPNNMTILGIGERQVIARGDEIVFTCAALAYHYAEDLEWLKDGNILLANDNLEITTSQSDYSYKKTLRFKSITDDDAGSYECRAKEVVNPEEFKSEFIDINVQEPYGPRTPDTNLDSGSTIYRKLGNSLELKCKAHAIPPAHVTWYRDDVELKAKENIAITDDETKLVIPFLKPEDEGTYKCIMANRLGAIEHSAPVKITNLPGLKLGWVLGIVFFFIVLIVLVIYLCVRVNRERKLLRELKAAGLANFEEGAVEHINPALTLDEQADLLPYDRRFEFPRHKLKLGKQLGAGAFGVVLKAHAEGIKADEKETVVAVKMVKRTADNEVMKALVSELKIMVHLGQHLNVVNLLGAVTENIAKREVMVIVEYCRYGNVQNFLLRNRKRFIDQINPETDKIDPTIVTQRFSDNFEFNRDGLKYVNLSFSNHQYINHMNNMNNNYTNNNRRNSNSDNDPRSGTRAGRPNSSGYLRQSDLYEGQVDSCATEQTVMTTIPEGEDHVLSNNSVQPAWRSNYKTDSTEAMTITTSDLVGWAFQVARGMDYLSSRKVLHGDLAARNILLCEDNVVKICDFGLARSMYKSENYKKQGEARLPIKWLALESLSDHVFSTYTDVWSFGIVLWEFFSLAKVPYPGMDPNQDLYMKLKDGYRMEKPPFANLDLYDIMLECWSTNPESRPLFHVLEQKFAKMLEDDITNHYLELNTTYLRANDEYFKRNETDYLALMGSPDELAPPPPRYVNGHILPEIRIDTSSDDYVQMSTHSGTAIFSPTRPKDFETTNDNTTTTTSFTFPDTAAQQHSPTLANNLDSPTNKSRKKEGVQPEEIPMLHKIHDSDGDSSPEQARKYNKTETPKHSRAMPTPSPRHHVEETALTDDVDGYVNVKSPKKIINNNNSARASPDAFSNPSYQMLKTVNESAK